MFGTEMTCIAFVVIILQAIGLLYGVFLLSLKSHDYSLRLFVLLTLVFIVYNTAGALLPDPRFSNLIAQRVFADLTGLIMCLYTFFYFAKEYANRKLLIKEVAGVVIVSSLILFILEISFSQIEPFRSVFLVLMVIIAAYLVYNIFSNYVHNSARVGGYMVFCSVLTLPLITIFASDNQFIEVPLVNFGYFVLMVMYFRNTSKKIRAKIEDEGLFSQNRVKDFKERYTNLENRLSIIVGYLSDEMLTDNEILKKSKLSVKTYRNYKSEIWKSLNFNTLHLKSEAEKRNILRQYIMRL